MKPLRSRALSADSVDKIHTERLLQPEQDNNTENDVTDPISHLDTAVTHQERSTSLQGSSSESRLSGRSGEQQ
jgi:hypothetical protein